MRAHLRTRLFVAMVVMALGVLLFTTLLAAGLARNSSADAAIDDLKRRVPTVAQEVTNLGRRFQRVSSQGRDGVTICRLLQGALTISRGGLIEIDSNGAVEEGISGVLGANCVRDRSPLPPHLKPTDLDIARLRAGHRLSGVRGSTAFVAQPLTPTDDRTPVLVISQQVETNPLGRAGSFLLATGALALLAAALISAYLARRLTRPIAAIQQTAGLIAAGDLSARVDMATMPSDEVGELARSIDAMADELETARGHERSFLLNISHDLRTPLTSIKGYAEALADGTIGRTIDGDEQLTRSAGIIAAETRRLERLVTDLLDLARLDAHEFSLSPRSVDGREVVVETVAGFGPVAREWSIELTVEPGDPVLLQTDPERLAQITANLVENALKYATSEVRVAVTSDGGGLEVRVDDDGPGIPVDERERIFERLYTVRGISGREMTGRKVGTGIGLAVVRQLAGALGGTAACEPLPAGGTRFLITLPG